ncbi:MAG: FMN-binding negative transcriptional regulator [Bryobacterales bacterium]|nr:FMN-binding negative transcriptional regulator [Bryobacterales bacterium]
MYIPRHFREEETATLWDFMEQNSFGLLVTSRDGGPFASHVPLLLDRTRGPYGTLSAHVARANPHADDALAQASMLAVFHGPHAYISPAWYAEPRNVPTWNYVAVHAYGKPRVISDPGQAMALLERMIAAYDRQWRLPPGAEWAAKMLNGIVAFEIEIEKLEGKFKLNQNRTAADRKGVIEALSQSTDHAAAAIANIMHAHEV